MQQSAWQTGNINCMPVDFTAKQPESLRVYKSPHCISANVGLNGYLFSGMPAEIGKKEEDEEFHTRHRSFFHLQTSPPTPNLYPNEQLFLSSHIHDGKVATHDATISQRKKFFIFDRSGAETRMILSSLSPPITNQTATASKLGNFNFLRSEQACPEVNDLFESNEDHIIGEGSDYHEDTEEINALLYSDNDDVSNNQRDGGDEDEVSTGRSPLTLENDSDDEVNSLICPPKRQKSLAFGSSNKLSSMATEPKEMLPPGLYEDESVVDVNTCSEESCPAVGTKRSRRDKIRNKLRMLENLIPGSKGKDPLLIIEEAIDYLKSLKAKANPLHVEDPARPSCCGPRL